jgi:hypothetical protein
MFKVGDLVKQDTATKTVPKGTVGEIVTIISSHSAYIAYEVSFQLPKTKLYRLRYEYELKAYQLPVGQQQTSVGTPKYKVGDHVTIIQKSSNMWSQSGEVVKVNTILIPWVYTIEFAMPLQQLSFMEKDLIASTRPMPKNPFMRGIGIPNMKTNTPPVKSKGPCVCGALHTSNPNCHAHWCDAS